MHTNNCSYFFINIIHLLYIYMSVLYMYMYVCVYVCMWVDIRTKFFSWINKITLYHIHFLICVYIPTYAIVSLHWIYKRFQLYEQITEASRKSRNKICHIVEFHSPLLTEIPSLKNRCVLRVFMFKHFNYFIYRSFFPLFLSKKI